MRIAWLDAAKGIGIVLVVVGHALGGLIDSPIGADVDPFRLGFLGIYTFHMPLFFLLSGLMVERRIERGPRSFLKSLLPTIVWPYFLWSTLQLAVIFSIGSLANRPVDNILPAILSLPWQTVSQFWFLYALFWLHVLAVMLVPKVGREGFVLLALAAKACVLIVPMPFPMRLVANHSFFYAIGVWLAVGGLETLIARHSTLVRAIILPLIASAAIAATIVAAPHYASDTSILSASSPEIANVAWRFPAMSAAILGVAAVIGVSMLGAVSGLKTFRYLGRRTMPIFLTHILFVAGARIVLIRLGLADQLWALLATLIVVGIAGPLMVDLAASRLRLSRILGFG